MIQQQVSHNYYKVYKGLTMKEGIEVSLLYSYLLDLRTLSEKTTENGLDFRTFKDEDGYYCVASYQKIIDELGIKEHALRRAKKRLKELGLIKEKRQLQGGNKIYVYDIPLGE